MAADASTLECIRRLEDSVGRALVGKPEVVRLAVIGLLARGHLLIEDVPGVGKTTLGAALARSIGGGFQRIQFTSDMLPSDVLGIAVYQPERGDFVFKPGPLFTNIVLADEINRTTPKTQSSLLEAMNEAQVSLDHTTHVLPQPVHGARHPEPAGVRRHLSAARVAARPLSPAHPHRIPRRARREGDSPRRRRLRRRAIWSRCSPPSRCSRSRTPPIGCARMSPCSTTSWPWWRQRAPPRCCRWG